MDRRSTILAHTTLVTQIINLLVAKIGFVSAFIAFTYALTQTFFMRTWPGWYDFVTWYTGIGTSDKISFLLLFVTIVGFFVTFHILTQNRRSESYTKAILSAADELHQSTQGILSILNKYEFYFNKILDTNGKILERKSNSRDIEFAIRYLSGQKDKLSTESDELGKHINALFSANSKNAYIYLLENVNAQHEKLTQIAAHIHLQCMDINIVYDTNNFYDFTFFSSQVDQRSIHKRIQLIRIGRDCIAKLSGFINGKFISHIAPTRVLSTIFIIKNRQALAEGMFQTSDMCIVEIIDRIATDAAAHIAQTSIDVQPALKPQETEAVG